jgi:ferredoxin
MPRPDDLLRRMLTLLRAYEVGGGEAGGGKRPVLLLHDGDFGENMIDTMARHYDGLPANMLPIAVNALAQCGLDSLLAARVYGAGKTLVLAAPKDEEELAPLLENIALTNHILGELGFRDGGVEIILEADPEVANARLWAATSDHASDRTVAPRPAAFEPTAEKRTALNLALMALHRVAPEPRDEIDLPPGAPFGTVDIDVDNCTLCMACAGVCPTNALRDTPDYPRLSFVETACVQCGLCAATCPEKVITLRPRLGFTGAVRNTRVIKEEEPFDCIRCGEPFATKSMIDAVTERMTSHSMFPNDKALRRLKMCADCRVIDMAETSPDPMAGAARPRVRTTDEYISGRYTDEDDDE